MAAEGIGVDYTETVTNLSNLGQYMAVISATVATPCSIMGALLIRHSRFRRRPPHTLIAPR